MAETVDFQRFWEREKMGEAKMKGWRKDFEWAVVVTCQGNPNYYKYRNLVTALCAYAWHYLKNRKYNTMNFTLR